jgi:hypothetical protein
MKTRNSQLSMFKVIAQGAAALTMLLLASAASAQECQADADCDAGYRCELYGGDATVCVGTPEGEEICEESEPGELIGYCVREPIPCTSDADCGDGLKCHLPDVGVAPDEEPAPPCPEGEDCGSSEPAPGDDNNSGLVAPQGYCGWAFADCATDADCGEFGECVSVGGSDCAEAAPFPGCAEGEDCPELWPVDCGEPVEIFACVPAEIDCETDDQCPTDWACIEYTEGYCEGSEGSGGATDPSEGEGRSDEPVSDEDEPSCFEETFRRCAPPGLDYGVGIAESGTGDPRELDGEPEAPAQNDGDGDSAGVGDEGDTDEDAGGCSVSGAGHHDTNGGLLAGLLLGLTALIARRRG